MARSLVTAIRGRTAAGGARAAGSLRLRVTLDHKFTGPPFTTGLASARTPVFRPFPRCGVPPHYGDWKTYCERVELMMRAGAIEDYTYMWWDVRPHPNLGTVETRIFDQQTRLEHTVALAALTAALAHAFSAQFDAGRPSIDFPIELIDDNKIRAALRGLEGELIDFFHRERVAAPKMALALLDELADH